MYENIKVPPPPPPGGTRCMPGLSIDQCCFVMRLIALAQVQLINYKLAHNVSVLLVLITSRTSECPDESLHMTIL